MTNSLHSIKLNGLTYSKDTNFNALSFLDKDTQQFLTDWFNDKETVLVQTSGSTGNPKTLEVHKKYLLASAKSTCDYLGLNQETNALLCLPTAYIGGKMMVVRAIYAGYNLVIGSTSKNPFKAIQENIDFVAMTPYQFSYALEESFDQLNTIKHMILGGASLSSELIKQSKTLKGDVYETFGMTETLSHVALKNCKKEDIFHLLPPTSIKVTKDMQLVIHAPHLGIKELITNDIVKLIDSKSFKWLGRMDFIINSGGIKIHPELIENEISKQLKVSQEKIFITSLPDALLGEKVVLCSLLPSNSFSFDYLSKYEVPKEIYTLNEFAYTPNGKINRIETRKKLLDQIDILT